MKMSAGNTENSISDIERLHGVIQDIKLKMAQNSMDFDCYGLERLPVISPKYISAICELLKEAADTAQKNAYLTGIVAYFKQSGETVRLNIFLNGKIPMDHIVKFRNLSLGREVIELGGSVYIRILDDSSGIVIVAEIKK